MTAILLATLFAAVQPAAADAPRTFSILRYNTPGTAFIKAGLFAWPMVMDYDGDGDLDIVVRSHGVPARHHGTWFFENTGKPGDLHPLFKPARRLGDEGWVYGGASAQTLADGRLAVTGPGNVAFDFRENGMRNVRTFAGLPKNVHENNVRGNIWRFVDLDGDGREDLTVGVGDWKEYGWDNAWDSAGVWTNGPLHGYVYFIRNESGLAGKEKWGRPEKVRMANGAPIDVYGSAAPLFADWDGDGDLDLLTCDFVDSYTYFENIGTKTEPKFACGRPILDKFLRPIKADLCMVTATVADWDGDGFPDVIACEEDARVCLIHNTGRVEMGVPVFEAPHWFRQTERDNVHFGILATPSVIDWDGDGDEDIITGNSAGYVAFIENLSGRGVAEPKWAEPVLLEADGAPIRIIAGPNGSIQGPCEAKWGYTCLSTGDWDGDGLPDIMINSIRGEVVWCRNIGTRTAPRLAPPAPVAAEWEGEQPELAWGWMKPNGSKNILTQWRTTPLMYDMNGDGLMDLVMVDTEGFLAFWERARAADGRLVLKPPRRAFIDDATGAPMGVSGWKGDGKGRAGSSGRRKLCLVDWDGDGKPDLIMNSENVILWRQVRAEDGCWRFARQGNLADEKLAGHTTSPCACDFDDDGVADLLVGAEDGFFYHLANKGGKTEMFDVSPRKVVNIVNFVRALDPRRPKSEHLRALREEVALNLKYGFENTILLQYDALVDAEMMAEARKSDPAKTEFGLWFEMSRPHNEAAGLEWRPSEKHKGWDWDWFINPGFLMSYDHDGRRKLIDAAFAKFKAEFGAWPKSVGSWLLDAWSMDYMVKTYGVDGFCICREQDSTDAYGLRGGYSNGAYYPSRKNMLSAAVDMKNAVRAPVFKMLTPDPIYNYGLPHKLYQGYPHSGGCPTMEPVWYGGHTPTIVDWYFSVYTEPKGLLNLSYMQTGQENAFGWPMISKGLPMQCAKIAAEAAAGRVVVEKMGDTARAFKAAHGTNCPQTQIALEDWTGAGRKSVWYNSRFYRANLLMEGRRLFFRDIHKMSDDFEEPFLDKVCTGWQALYYTPPVVDQWLFRSEEASGTMELSGEFESLETATEGDSVLVVTARRADGTSATVRFEEGRIVVAGCGLSAEYAADFRKAISVEGGGVDFEFGGYSYSVPVRGKMRATEKGFRMDGDRTELDLSSDGSKVFNGGLWRTFTYDRPSATPVFFSGESRCEGVTEGQYCIYLDIWYDDGKPVWGKKAAWEQGTHGWEKVMGAFVPAKPVKKIEMYAFLRRGCGKAQFRNLRLERREGNGDVLNFFRRTERPYANQDRILRDVFIGRKIDQQVEKVPASPPYADNPLAPDDVVVWTADSMRKVTPLTFPGERERNEKPAARLSLARRESESFQVQVSTGANAEWREGGVTLPVLRNASGEAFKGTVEWRRVGYVAREPGYHTHPQGAPETELWLPDPLLPPAPFRVRRSSTQGLWFTVKAAPDAPAGEYSGDIALTEGGERRATVHVTARVEDFSLPETFGMQTAFSVMDGFTRAQYPDRFREKRRESWDIMLDHRLNPDDISRTTPPEIGDLVHARSRGMNRFNILNIVPPPKDPKRKWVCAAPREATENPAFYPAFKARLEPYVAELRRHGLDKYAYIYGFDEREPDYYPGIDALWKKLKADFPDIPVMTTAMMYRDYAAGKTNLPCLVTTDWYCPLTKVYRTGVSDAMRRMGKKVWWYVCCTPNYPFANFASLEYLPIEGRILGWMTHLYRADGLLYWHVNWWKDACLDERDTYFPDWKTGQIPRMPGDGVLMYPGKDHILPSIRLAQVRDCVEDYEWLQLAASKVGAEAADAVSRKLIRSMTDFSRDPEQLMEMRSRLADVINGR